MEPSSNALARLTRISSIRRDQLWGDKDVKTFFEPSDVAPAR